MSIKDKLNRQCDQEYQGYFEFIIEIRDKVIPLRDTGISSRIYNHWKKEGLLLHPDEPSMPRKWEKLSFAEMIWLKCVNEMREFNVPFDIIRKVKQEITVPFDATQFLDMIKLNIEDPAENLWKKKFEKIFGQIDSLNLPDAVKQQIKESVQSKEILKTMQSDDTLFWFEILLAVSIFEFNEAGLFVHSDGSVILFSEESLDSTNIDKRNFFSSHLYISMTNQYLCFLNDENMSKYLDHFGMKSLREVQIMELLTIGGFDKMTINKMNSGMKITAEKRISIQRSELVAWKRKISNRYPYCKITEVVHDGKLKGIDLEISKLIRNSPESSGKQ